MRIHPDDGRRSKNHDIPLQIAIEDTAWRLFLLLPTHDHYRSELFYDTSEVVMVVASVRWQQTE